MSPLRISETAQNDDVPSEDKSDNGQATLVYDEASDEQIPFGSASDALIAQLYLSRRVPPRHLATFLELLQNPAFDARKVSFGVTTDVDVHVSRFRTERAQERGKECVSGTGLTLPLDIFAMVVDYVEVLREPLVPTVNGSESTSNDGETKYPVAKTLKAISLTHRALTRVAQMALGRRVHISSKHLLSIALRSPLLGGWTTELIICAVPNGASDLTRPTNRETVDLVVAILRQTPRLRFLSIRTPPYEYKDDPDISTHAYGFGSAAHLMAASQMNLLRLLNVISRELPELEELWWRAKDRCSVRSKVDLVDVCEAVERMEKLKRLVVRGVVCRAGKELWSRKWGGVRRSGELGGERRKHGLTSLSLTGVDFLAGAGFSPAAAVASTSPSPLQRYITPSLSYLLSPDSNRSTLTSLTIDLAHTTRHTHTILPAVLLPPTNAHSHEDSQLYALLEMLQGVLPCLEELRVQLRCPSSGVGRDGEVAERLFGACGDSLKRLHVWVLPPVPGHGFGGGMMNDPLLFQQHPNVNVDEDGEHPHQQHHHHHLLFPLDHPIDDTFLRHIPTTIQELHLGLFNIGDDPSIWDEQDMHLQIWLDDDMRWGRGRDCDSVVIDGKNGQNSLRRIKLLTPALKHLSGMYMAREACMARGIEFEHLEDSLAVFI